MATTLEVLTLLKTVQSQVAGLTTKLTTLDGKVVTVDANVKALQVAVSELTPLEPTDADPVVVEPGPTTGPVPVPVPTTGPKLLDISVTGKSIAQLQALGLDCYLGGSINVSLLKRSTWNGVEVLESTLPSGTRAITDLQQRFPKNVRNGRFTLTAAFKPGFTTVGGTTTTDAAALKVLRGGLVNIQERWGGINLEVTQRNQYQCWSDGGLVNMNSWDANQGTQRKAVGSEWSDGVFHDYWLGWHHIDDKTMVVYGSVDGGTPLHIQTIGAASGIAPDVYLMQLMAYYNQVRNFATAIYMARWTLEEL